MNEITFQNQKKMLLIDSSGPLLFLSSACKDKEGLWQTEQFILSRPPREHDSWLKESVEQFLNIFFMHTPPLIALGKGPGSFTSLRAGFTFVSTLTLLWQIPKMTFSSYHLFKKIIANELSQNKNSVLLLRANRYVFFGEHQNEIKAWSAQEWHKHYSSFLFFDYENKAEIEAEFSQAVFVSFQRASLDDQIKKEQNPNIFSLPTIYQENFHIDSLFDYPQDGNSFPFEPEYGIDIVFKKKKDAYAI